MGLGAWLVRRRAHGNKEQLLNLLDRHRLPSDALPWVARGKAQGGARGEAAAASTGHAFGEPHKIMHRRPLKISTPERKTVRWDVIQGAGPEVHRDPVASSWSREIIPRDEESPNLSRLNSEQSDTGPLSPGLLSTIVEGEHESRPSSALQGMWPAVPTPPPKSGNAFIRKTPPKR